MVSENIPSYLRFHLKTKCLSWSSRKQLEQLGVEVLIDAEEYIAYGKGPSSILATPPLLAGILELDRAEIAEPPNAK